MNTLCACISLPALITPLSLIYLMVVAVPVLSTTLVRTDPNPQIMNRATGKKQTKYNSAVFIFVLFCYGCKFLPTTLIMVRKITLLCEKLHCIFQFYIDSFLLYIHVASNSCVVINKT